MASLQSVPIRLPRMVTVKIRAKRDVFRILGSARLQIGKTDVEALAYVLVIFLFAFAQHVSIQLGIFAALIFLAILIRREHAAKSAAAFFVGELELKDKTLLAQPIGNHASARNRRAPR